MEYSGFSCHNLSETISQNHAAFGKSRVVAIASTWEPRTHDERSRQLGYGLIDHVKNMV